jgi:hypothetical protein
MKNYKAHFWGLLILTLGYTSYGQTNKIEIGIEGSPSLVFLRGNDVIDNTQKPTIGVSCGLFFQYNINKFFSLRTNLAYERKGSRASGVATDIKGNYLGEITINTNFDYVTLPILARATYGKKIHLFVNSGPYIGYLFKHSIVITGDNIPTTTDEDISQYKRFDIGITGGLGLSIPIKTKFAFSFEVRNNLGLNNISQAKVVNDGTIKTNSTNFLLGLSYKLTQRN